MDGRTKLTLGLLGTAVLAGTALGLGVGRPPRPENPGVVAVRREATASTGRAIFGGRGCAQCHGPDGGGTQMGPGLGEIVVEYFGAAKGDRAAAKQRLVRYLKDPKGAGTLRRDPTLYPNPMPSAPKLGCSDAEIDDLAEFLLGMSQPSVSVGGDASGR